MADPPPDGRPDTRTVLVLNVGSSTVKAHAYRVNRPDLAEPTPPICRALMERSDEPEGHLRVWTDAAIPVVDELVPAPSFGVARVLEEMSALLGGDIDMVGHRIVHGGRLEHSALLTERTVAIVEEAIAIAPLHLPGELTAIAIARDALPTASHVAVLDTAFHRTIPEPAARYPLPDEPAVAGIRRRGFHGPSHAYATARAAKLDGRPLEALRIVSCHLGSGSSLAAVRGGNCVDTTMGFTPLEGLMMGTRSGTVDPGIILQLLDTMARDEVADLLQRRSGLLGVSGLSADLRDLSRAAAGGHREAGLAIRMYVHRLRRELGGMVASLEGIDLLVFTGGIGENAARIRTDVCRSFEFLGMRLDEERNGDTKEPDRTISHRDSSVAVAVLAAREEWAIATECWRVVQP